MKEERNYTCSFFGHRKTEKNEKLKEKVRETVENLIAEENVFCFLFGSKSGTEIVWRKAEKKEEKLFSYNEKRRE